MCLLPLWRKLFISHHNSNHLSHHIMLKKLLLMAATIAIAAPAFAQATKEEKLKEKGEVNKLPQGWTKKAALGLGGNYVGNYQPAVGGGNDQLGLNGILTGAATYRAGRMVWDNAGGVQYGVLKSSPIGVSFDDVPLTKPVDNIQLASKFNYGVSENSVWFYTLASTFRSQVTPTYTGGLFAKPTGTDAKPLAEFLSPAYFAVSPGMDYKPTENISVLFSPASLRMVIVSNPDIAALGLISNLKNGVDLQVGASLTASYKESFFTNRVQFQTGLNLYSNYIIDPQNVDVEWGTTTKFNIFKGFGISYNTNLFYDHDRKVVVKDNTITSATPLIPAGYRLVASTTFIHGFFVTYDRTF
jgi:hypothetical protein